MVQQREQGERIAPGLEHGEDVPVGVQLAWRLEALIESGRLVRGQRLPGVRELAAGAGVNVNTARAVYRRLEERELVVSRQGTGTFVSADALVSPGLEGLAAEVASEAFAQGIEPRQLARALYVGADAERAPFEETVGDAGAKALEESVAPPGRNEAQAARRALRGQIARLEAELAPYPEAGARQPEGKGRAEPTPHLADVGELERVRDDLITRLKRARAGAEAQARREQAARGRLDAMVRDPAAHRWQAVAEQDMGGPGSATWEVVPTWGPVGALMNWWRVKVTSR